MKTKSQEYLSFLFYFSVISLFSLYSKNTFSQKTILDLSFENNISFNSNWMLSIDPKLYVFADTADVIEGKQSLVFADRSAKIYPVNDFIAAIFQYIEFPDTVREIDISISSKTKLVGDAWMKAYILNQEGLIILRDSVGLISSDWHESHLNLSPSHSVLLYLEIFMHNKHDKNEKDISKTPCLWVDNIQIKLNGKDIKSYPVPEFKPFLCDINSCEHVKLNMTSTDNISLIKDFKYPKILAFGETVHTSFEIQQFILNAIKELIIKNNCRLVLMEIPFEIGLRLNEYINGNENVNIEELLYFLLINPDEFISLLNWMKDYNAHNISKVNLVGIDDGNFLSELDYHLYLSVCNNKSQSKIFKSFTELLREEKYKEALITINNSESIIKTELGSIRFSEIIRALELRNEMIIPDNDMPDTYRDYILFENAKLAINNYRYRRLSRC